MAKKANLAEEATVNKATAVLLGELRKKLNTNSIENSTLANISEYIDTGSYALNLIISGDMFKGLPRGRVITFYGEEASGKSLIAQVATANCLNVNKFDIVFLVDSEGGNSRDNYENLGCPLDKIEHVPVRNIEDAAYQLFKIFETIETIQKETPEFKAMVILDSLGALKTRKVFTDISNDTAKLDRGLRARLCNDMLGTLLMPALITGTPFIIINHIYDDPAAMFTSKLKNQGGGRGIKFATHIAIQCTKQYEKNEEKDKDSTAEGYYKGTVLKFFTSKNRIAVPFLETKIAIDFAHGITSKFIGLEDLAIKHGLLEDGHGIFKFKIPEGKEVNVVSIKKPDLFTSAKANECWEAIKNILNEKAKAEIQYGGLFSNTVTKELLADADIEDGLING